MESDTKSDTKPEMKSDMKSGSNFEKILMAGHFAFTGELGPPRGCNVEHIKEKTSFLKGNVDMVNITDNQTAMVRMSSWAAAIILMGEGLEPNYQMVCRDRNRLAMQADLLGAYAHGLRNILCLSGDHQQFGDHPFSKGVFDIDSMQLVAMVKKMRDEGKFLGGADIAKNIAVQKGTEELKRLLDKALNRDEQPADPAQSPDPAAEPTTTPTETPEKLLLSSKSTS